jgi:DNA-binding MarR family transcriptional regulator
MDVVGRFREQWEKERPDIDTSCLEAWGRLKRTAAVFDRGLMPAMGEHGLSIADFEVLAALRRSGPPYQLRPAELTRSLIVTAGAITNRLDNLERRGLISRARLAGDRRGHAVLLTPEGVQIFDPALDAVIERSEALLTPILAELDQLLTILRTLADAMEPDERNGGIPDNQG